jgi:hypothetical protein
MSSTLRTFGSTFYSPVDKNPVNDPTGDNCAVNQRESNSSVFYLSGCGGGDVERTCKEGKVSSYPFQQF